MLLNLGKVVLLNLIILMSLFSCESVNDCNEYLNETYVEGNSNLEDSIAILVKQAFVKYGEVEELETKLESYRLVYSHSLSKISNIWTFEQNDKGCVLTFKEFEYNIENEKPELKEILEIDLSEKEWKHVKYLITNFNFWTTKQYIANEVADGGGYLIDGYRPGAGQCDKLERKIVIRSGALKGDEISWMCSDLISIYLHKSDK